MPDAAAQPGGTELAAHAPGVVSIRAMSVRSILALGLLAILSLGGFLLLQGSLEAQDRAATALRVGWRQHFLAQRIVFLAIRLVNPTDPVATRARIQELLARTGEIERTHEALIRGDPSLGLGGRLSPEIRAILFEEPTQLDHKIRSFLDRTRELARRSDADPSTTQASMDFLGTISQTPMLEELSSGLDSLIEEFQREGDARIRYTRRLEIGVFVTTLLVLLAMGLFVFRPMALRVRKDIEDLQRAQAELSARAEELQRSNAELEQFAYVATHDLQEPLRMVAAYVQLLERRYRGKLGPDADESIRFASEGAVRMHELLMDLLAYSRVGTHGGEMVPVECDSALRDALADMKLAIEESRAEVRSASLPRVRADAVQIRQLFQNLIGNAIKFRGENPPRIRIDVQRGDGEWTFAVRDNGIGFDMRFAKRIFVIFQRLHARGHYPGTGIGLAVCQKIVLRHRGRIWAESEPGEGSTFFFTLPAEG